MKNIRKKSFTFFKEVLSTIVNNQKIFKSFGSWKKTNDNFSIHDLIGNVEKAKEYIIEQIKKDETYNGVLELIKNYREYKEKHLN